MPTGGSCCRSASSASSSATASFIFIGRFWGTRLVERPFIRKHILTPERLQKITDNFHDYGIRILLFARLTPGIRTPIFLTAGITRLPLMRFVLADGIYAIPGVSILFVLGYAFTDRIVDLIENEAGKVKSIIILVVLWWAWPATSPIASCASPS